MSLHLERPKEKCFALSTSVLPSISSVAMNKQDLVRQRWQPKEGIHTIKIEDTDHPVVETSYGLKKIFFIQVDDKPYVWMTNHYENPPRRSVEHQLKEILSKKPDNTGTIKVLVSEIDNEKTYCIIDPEHSPDSILISVEVHIPDVEKGLHLVHSETIPINRGER